MATLVPCQPQRRKTFASAQRILNATDTLKLSTSGILEILTMAKFKL